MLKSKVAQFPDHIETLPRRNVPYRWRSEIGRLEAFNDGRLTVSALFQLGKDPGLDERAAGDHDAVHSALLHVLPVRSVVVRVAVAEDRNRCEIVVLDGLPEDVDALPDVCFPNRRRDQSRFGERT